MTTSLRVAIGLLVALVAVACKARQEATPDAAAPPPVLDAAPPRDALDAAGAKKKGDGCTVTFVGATQVSKSAAIAFVIDNEGDSELPISGRLSTQAVTMAGLSGDLDERTLAKNCLGMAPPHGRFVCSVIYNFDEPPTELRLRAEGAWFHVKLAPSDAAP